MMMTISRDPHGGQDVLIALPRMLHVLGKGRSRPLLKHV